MPIVVSTLTPLLQVFDMQRSLQFYCDVLGCTIHDSAGPKDAIYWVKLNLGDTSLMLNTQFEEDHQPSSPDLSRTVAHADTILYFLCESTDDAYSQLLEKGWQVRKPTTSYYGMRQVYTKDPDGYEICFQHPALQDAS